MNNKVQVPQRFVVADDHPLFRLALRQAILSAYADASIDEAADVEGLLRVMAGRGDVALILLDLHMPGASGFSSLVHLCAAYPAVPVIMVSADATTEVISRSVHHGAAGFLPKSSSLREMQSAIAAVLDGGHWWPEGFVPLAQASDQEDRVAVLMAQFTPQQVRVAGLLSRGLLNKQIASEMSVTEATVKAHATEIYRKLGVNSRTQAVLALQHLASQGPVLASD